MFAIDEGLSSIGETPIRTKQLLSRAYCRRKFARIGQALQSEVFRLSEVEMENEEEKWLWQLKEKFSATTSRSEQVTILTLLPKSWSLRRVQKEFSTTFCMARTSRQLVEIKEY